MNTSATVSKRTLSYDESMVHCRAHYIEVVRLTETSFCLVPFLSSSMMLAKDDYRSFAQQVIPKPVLYCQHYGCLKSIFLLF